MNVDRTAEERERAALFTIGHSIRSLDELVAILQEERITVLVDVRTVPRSRHTPQFNKDALERELPRRGMEYRHCPSLGGLRRGLGSASPNTGWRNVSFRGFADYMLTEEFRQALEELLAIARQGRTAIMCAEAVPWRCHRSLIADALAVREVPVWHLLAANRGQPHRLTSFARFEGGQLVYPGPAEG